jgi:hypothetical protein
VKPTPPSTIMPGLEAYTSGVAALASGETTKAVGLLKSAAEEGNTQAAERLAEIAGTTSSTAAPGAPLTDDALSKPVSEMSSLLPTSMTGYTAAQVERSPISAILAFAPTHAGPYGKVSIVVLSVIDKGTDADARAYVEQFDRAYPANGEAVTVGMRQGRFGTDGSHLAAVVFSRGRYAFEAVATATRSEPSTVRDITIMAAAEFPAAQ